ncbi:MAG: hypothetical protein AAGD38_02775 [Acidobacteriota bacterium]
MPSARSKRFLTCLFSLVIVIGAVVVVIRHAPLWAARAVAAGFDGEVSVGAARWLASDRVVLEDLSIEDFDTRFGRLDAEIGRMEIEASWSDLWRRFMRAVSVTDVVASLEPLDSYPAYRSVAWRIGALEVDAVVTVFGDITVLGDIPVFGDTEDGSEPSRATVRVSSYLDQPLGVPIGDVKLTGAEVPFAALAPYARSWFETGVLDGFEGELDCLMVDLHFTADGGGRIVVWADGMDRAGGYWLGEADPSPDGAIRGVADVVRLDVATAMRWLDPGRTLAPGSLGFVDGEGGVREIEDTPTFELDWTWSPPEGGIAASLEMLAIEIPETVDSVVIDGSVTGRLLGTRDDGVVIDGRADLHTLRLGGEMAEQSWTFDGETTIDARYTQQLEVAPVEVVGKLDVGPLESLSTALTAQVSMRDLGSPPEVEVITARVEDLAPMTLRPAGSSVRMEADSLRLDRLRTLLAPLVDDPAPEASLAGRLTLDAELSQTGSSTWRATGGFALRDVEAASVDFSRVVQGLAADGAWRWRAEDGLRIDGELGGFEMLWGSVYGDWHDVRFPVAIDVAPPSVALTVELPEAGSWAVEGRHEQNESWTGSYDLTVPAIEPVWRTWLETPLAGSLGALEGMRLGGRVTSTGRFAIDTSRGPLDVSVDARLAIEDGQVAGSAYERSISGLDLELPLHLRRRADGSVESLGEPRNGRLAFTELRAGDLTIPAVETTLVVAGDAVELVSPLELDVLGGRVSLRDVAGRALLRPERHLAASVSLAGLDLATFPGDLGLVGSVDAELPAVRLSPERLEVDGGGTASMFGGRVEVGSISGRHVFSRYPRFRLSASFTEIDLEQLTARLGFGAMSGSLDGTIEALELFGVVPTAFEAEVFTVDRPGVERTITVKAVRDISILGGGAAPGAIDNLLTRLINRFTYREAYADLALADDVFTLYGKRYQDDGPEYFVRGRFPFPINVVNARPGQAVSFRGMLARLRAIGSSRVDSGPTEDP